MDAVVFDLGNVLIEWNPLRVVSDAFVAEANFYAWNMELDQGALFDDVVARWCEAHPEHADEVRAFQERWHETLGDVDEEVLAIVGDLRANGVGVFGLTNSSMENAPKSEDVQRVFRELDGVVVSGEVRLVKPHREIYEHTAQRFGLTPERTWFVDDNAANVAGAVACGWNGILFTGAAVLRTELSAAGLIPADERSN